MIIYLYIRESLASNKEDWGNCYGEVCACWYRDYWGPAHCVGRD